MELYLEGEEIPKEKLVAAIRKATIAGEFVPVLCGTSYRNKGVQKLLDAIVDYLPSPLDVPSVIGHNPHKPEEEVIRHADDSEPFSALAFKIVADPYVGKLAFFRVYSGVLTNGSYIFNSTKGTRDRVGRILLMHANHREDVDEVRTGDIAAMVGLKDTGTGDSLCAENAQILLESMEFPDPVIQVAIEPKTKAGQEKMSAALIRLAEEDPTFKTFTNAETGQTIIAGMGELHLEIIVDRLLREFKVEATVGNPQVAYRETLRKAVMHSEGRFVRQSGGHGQYGHCIVDFEPTEPGSGFTFESKIVGGTVPKEYVQPICDGIMEAAKSGLMGGYEVVDFKATLIDGSYHEVDSNENAFKVAGSMAFKAAMEKSGMTLLEPTMKVEVVLPDEFMGDIMGNLTARRGQIEGSEPRGSAQIIHAMVPLAEMFGYATDLRSRTHGRATFTMQFSHYQPVPHGIASKLLGLAD